MFTSTIVAFAAFALSVSALATPHAGNSHRGIAARVAAPEAAADSLPVVRSNPSRRASRKRCAGGQHSSKSLVSSTSTKTSTTSVATHKATAAPKTTTSTSTKKAATTTKTASTPAGTQAYLVGKQTGEATYYGTGLGACGITNSDDDMIVAVSHKLFDTYPGYNYDNGAGNPNNNPVCNKQITASYKGKSVTVIVTDRCTGCDTTDLDFAPAAFSKLADQSLGRLTGMTWVWS